MKKYRIYSIGMILISFIFLSCSDIDDEGYEDYEAFNTGVSELSGDYFVQTFVGDNLVLGFEKITISNTAANDGEVWIDDRGNIWPFKIKTSANGTNLSFSGSDTSIRGDAITVTISNGTVVKDGVVTDAGNSAYSISFEAEFSDDPGTTYKFIGFKRTGFSEDEH